MAAGLGFKDFTTGEVLTAADVDGYLMQGVWVFASAAARDAAVTSPQEGNFAYLKDTNVTTYYTGSAWANLDTTGMTNPMTTTGDTIYSSSGSTPARLGIGSTGQVLTVAGGVPSWATPGGAGSSYTLLNGPSGTALTGAATITVSGISGVDKVFIRIDNTSSANGASAIGVRFNTDSASNYLSAGAYYSARSSLALTLGVTGADNRVSIAEMATNAGSTVYGSVLLTGCNSSGLKQYVALGGASTAASSTDQAGFWLQGIYNSTSTISSISILSSSGNFDGGTVYVYTSA